MAVDPADGVAPGPEAGVVRWRLRLASPPARVYDLVASNEGRARFWAEAAIERDGVIQFEFPNGMRWRGEILGRTPGEVFSVRYLGGTTTTFRFAPGGHGGTDLELTDEGVPAADILETTAGWVSVLLALKAAVDFDVDLRNHDAARTWDEGYADN